VDGTVALGQTVEGFPQLSVSGRRLGERQFGGGRLQVVAEEDSIVTVAAGVDADTEAARRLRSGRVVWSHGNLGRTEWREQGP
jgi:hypothetical protein